MKKRFKSFIFLLSLVGFLLHSSVYASDLCLSLFETVSLAEQQKLIDSYRKDPFAFLESLSLKPKEIEFESVLSNGESSMGVAILVNYRGRRFVLKLLRSIDQIEHSRLPPLQIKALRDDALLTRTDAVVIQKILGDLGIMPKITGIVGRRSTQTWLTENPKAQSILQSLVGSNVNFDFGIMMDYVSGGTFLKGDLNSSPLQVQSRFAAMLSNNLKDKIAPTLKSLGIAAEDPDAMIFANGAIILIDGDFYRFSDPSSVTSSNSAFFRALSKMISARVIPND